MRLARSDDIWRGQFKQTDRPIDFSSRIGKQVSFLRRPPRNILADRLALVLSRSLVVLIEDEAGALFAKALLESDNSKYVSHCGIFVAGGESEISRVLDIVRLRVPTTVTIGLKVVCQICATAQFGTTENQRLASVTRSRQASQVTVMVKIAI